MAYRTMRTRRLDPLDTDLLAVLEERDRRLYAILSRAIRYRNILREEVKRLRSGDAPEIVRATLSHREALLGEIKRLARDLCH